MVKKNKKRKNKNKRLGGAPSPPPTPESTLKASTQSRGRAGAGPSAWIAHLHWLIPLASVVVYLNTFGSEFTVDDIPIIEKNDLIQSLSDVPGLYRTHYWAAKDNPVDQSLYRPWTLTTFAVQNAIHGLAPAGYHVVNAALHAIASLFLYILVKQLSGDGVAAFVAALLFAVHPVHVESVANVTGRSDVMALLGTLVCCWAYFRAADAPRRHVPWWGALAVLAYFLGTTSKETGIVAPGVILASELLFPSRRCLFARRRRGFVLFFALGLVTIIFLLLREAAIRPPIDPQEVAGTPRLAAEAPVAPEQTGEPATPEVGDEAVAVAGDASQKSKAEARKPRQRQDAPKRRLRARRTARWIGSLSLQHFWTCLAILGDYFDLMVRPVDLSAQYTDFFRQKSAFAPAVVQFWVRFGVSVFLAALLWRKRPLLAWGMLFFLLTVFLPFLNRYVKADRLLYAPSAGFLVGVGALTSLVWSWPTARRGVVVVVALATLVLGGMTWDRNRDWSDNCTLAAATLETSPGSPLFLGVRGQCLMEEERFEEARECLERARTEDPRNVSAINNLGLVYMELEELEGAREVFTRLIELAPGSYESYANLLSVYRRLGRYEEALPIARKALRRFPNRAALHWNTANLNRLLGREDEAQAGWRRARELDPSLGPQPPRP